MSDTVRAPRRHLSRGLRAALLIVGSQCALFTAIVTHQAWWIAVALVCALAASAQAPRDAR